MTIQKDCCWWVDSDLPLNEQKLTGICLDCRKDKKLNKSWYWNGEKLGYGDYDLKCLFCQTILHERDKDENSSAI